MTNIKSFVLNKLKESSGSLRVISKELDIPYPTLLKIGQGVISNPGIDHMQKLYNYFNK
jgi:hypothetical protein